MCCTFLCNISRILSVNIFPLLFLINFFSVLRILYMLSIFFLPVSCTSRWRFVKKCVEGTLCTWLMPHCLCIYSNLLFQKVLLLTRDKTAKSFFNTYLLHGLHMSSIFFLKKDLSIFVYEYWNIHSLALYSYYFFYISWQDYFKNSTDSTDERVMKKRHTQTAQFYVVLKKMKLMELTGE